MQFSNVPSKPTKTVARKTFYQAEGSPWLDLAPMGRRNHAYFNELFREMSKLRRSMDENNLKAEDLDRLDGLTRDMIGKHVIVGMGGWLDMEGNEVEDTPDNRSALAHALPAEMINEIEEVASSDDSFR